jgi:hypothetical protein
MAEEHRPAAAQFEIIEVAFYGAGGGGGRRIRSQGKRRFYSLEASHCVHCQVVRVKRKISGMNEVAF